MKQIGRASVATSYVYDALLSSMPGDRFELTQDDGQQVCMRAAMMRVAIAKTRDFIERLNHSRAFRVGCPIIEVLNAATQWRSL